MPIHQNKIIFVSDQGQIFRSAPPYFGYNASTKNSQNLLLFYWLAHFCLNVLFLPVLGQRKNQQFTIFLQIFVHFIFYQEHPYFQTRHISILNVSDNSQLKIAFQPHVLGTPCQFLNQLFLRVSFPWQFSFEISNYCKVLDFEFIPLCLSLSQLLLTLCCCFGQLVMIFHKMNPHQKFSIYSILFSIQLSQQIHYIFFISIIVKVQTFHFFQSLKCVFASPSIYAQVSYRTQNQVILQFTHKECQFHRQTFPSPTLDDTNLNTQKFLSFYHHIILYLCPASNILHLMAKLQQVLHGRVHRIMEKQHFSQDCLFGRIYTLVTFFMPLKVSRHFVKIFQIKIAYSINLNFIQENSLNLKKNHCFVRCQNDYHKTIFTIKQDLIVAGRRYYGASFDYCHSYSGSQEHLKILLSSQYSCGKWGVVFVSQVERMRLFPEPFQRLSSIYIMTLIFRAFLEVNHYKYWLM